LLPRLGGYGPDCRIFSFLLRPRFLPIFSSLLFPFRFRPGRVRRSASVAGGIRQIEWIAVMDGFGRFRFSLAVDSPSSWLVGGGCAVSKIGTDFERFIFECRGSNNWFISERARKQLICDVTGALERQDTEACPPLHLLSARAEGSSSLRRQPHTSTDL